MSLSKTQNRRSRRIFVKALLYGLSLSGLGLLRSLLRREESLPEAVTTTLVVPCASKSGVGFYDQAIVVASEQGLSVFSSACPHLGCRLDRADGAEIVCSCHGSRFNTRGEVLRGPALRGLQPLRYEHDRASAVLRIVLKAT